MGNVSFIHYAHLEEGERARHKRLQAVEKAHYDLILMDIQMPDMNGVDAARIIRKNLGLKCPLIYALTAEALEGDKQRFLSLGFDGYLSKPLQIHTLQETLKMVNRNSHLSDRSSPLAPSFT